MSIRPCLVPVEQVAATPATDSSGLAISIRLAPSVAIDDIGERDTANRPETAHRITERDQRLGMHIGGQTERGFHFLLEIQIQGRQRRSETERPRRQKHVLNCRVN